MQITVPRLPYPYDLNSRQEAHRWVPYPESSPQCSLALGPLRIRLYDLATIGAHVFNTVICPDPSVEPDELRSRVASLSQQLDAWLRNLPAPYQFREDSDTPLHIFLADVL